MQKNRKIELLAPAKNKDIGIEAIKHGADAVYIGAAMHGARQAARNSLEDIAELVNYAHIYNAKVYVVLNTILSDEELERVEKLIWELYSIGVDAIIVQDMGITQLNLPPIPLHASTQMDNRTVEKAQFLEKAGFQQIVLARELSINEIKDIADELNIALEVFVHGALCVCYSGQCYLSEALSNRSANKGACAQYCRLPYDLEDVEGESILSKKHLLSMKDLNLSDDLEALLDAGVSSLKIEGRLKDIGYVKNTVTYYRKQLDEIFSERSEYSRASSGKSQISFEPNLEKSFNRGFTKYFLNDRIENIWSIDSPKSIGEPIGKVSRINSQSIEIDTSIQLNNGDGLCYLDTNGELVGLRVNRSEQNRVIPSQMPIISEGTMLYRNFDQEFDNILNKETACRYIDIQISFSESPHGFSIQGVDEDNNELTLNVQASKELARTSQEKNIINNLSKLGNTVFNLKQLELKLSQDWFIPASLLSQWRREFTDRFLALRRINYKSNRVFLEKTTHPFPSSEINYLGNVMNEKSVLFYQNHNVNVLEPAFEKKHQEDVALMFTRHCIKYSLGYCPKHQKEKHPYKEPFYLNYKNIKLRLEFDCKECEMKVYNN